MRRFFGLISALRPDVPREPGVFSRARRLASHAFWLLRLALIAMMALGSAVLAPAVASHARSSRVVAQASLDPQSLTDALASTPFLAAELPSGFTETSGPQAVPAFLLGQANASGAVYVPMDNGSGTVSAVVYVIFDNATDAQAELGQATGLIPGLQITSTSTPSGFDYPATLYSGSDSLLGGDAGGSACVVTVANVVVAGISVQPGNPQGGSPDDACALAGGGLTHLETILAGS